MNKILILFHVPVSQTIISLLIDLKDKISKESLENFCMKVLIRKWYSRQVPVQEMDSLAHS